MRGRWAAVCSPRSSDNQQRPRGTAMQTARYHREQAELCLEMARSMSDRQAADTLCTAAARHFAEALEVEKRQDHPPAPLVDVRNVTNKRPDDFSDSFYYRAIRTQIGEALR